MKDLAIANYNVGKSLNTLLRYKEASVYLRKAAAIVKTCNLHETTFGKRIIQTKKEVMSVGVYYARWYQMKSQKMLLGREGLAYRVKQANKAQYLKKRGLENILNRRIKP